MVREYCSTNGCRKWKDINNDGKCPRCVERLKKHQSAKSNDPIFPCGMCKQECEEDSRSTMCDCCETWFHNHCVDLSDEYYDVLMSIKRLRWFCEACDTRVDEALEKCNGLEKQTKALQISLANVEKRLDNVETKLAGTVHKEINSAINERADIERRKLNLVIYNLPEAIIPDETPSAWDSPDRRTKDTEKISDIIQKELKITMETNGKPKIVNAVRLGRRLIDNKERSTPRPIKLTFLDLQTKREVLTNSKELRNSDDQTARRIFVNPDLTEQQRKLDKQLREKMWKIREEQNKNVAIKKGEIVDVDYEVRKTRNRNTPPTPNVSNSNNNDKPSTVPATSS